MTIPNDFQFVSFILVSFAGCLPAHSQSIDHRGINSDSPVGTACSSAICSPSLGSRRDH